MNTSYVSNAILLILYLNLYSCYFLVHLLYYEQMIGFYFLRILVRYWWIIYASLVLINN